uniref:Uncharacterized protein n=1 Tax=viral metagenome TaxID=1070528 RepID=A0A6C0AF62_9ZZZZ
MFCNNCSCKLKNTVNLCFECKNLLVKNGKKTKKEYLICKECETVSNYKFVKDNYCKTCFNKTLNCNLCNKNKFKINTLNINGNILCIECNIFKCSSCLKNTDITGVKFFGDILCNECYIDDSLKSPLEIELMLNHNNIHLSCSNEKTKCCICKDIRFCRKNVKSYPGYDDEIGNVNNKSRWQDYCPQCTTYCQNIWDKNIIKPS